MLATEVSPKVVESLTLRVDDVRLTNVETAVMTAFEIDAANGLFPLGYVALTGEGENDDLG